MRVSVRTVAAIAPCSARMVAPAIPLHVVRSSMLNRATATTLQSLRKFSTEISTKKPRAEGTTTQTRRKRRVWVWAVPAGLLVAAGVASATTGVSPADVWKTLMASFEDKKRASDPSIDELQTALGPPPMEGLINVFIAMEDVILRKDWTSRYGWRYELRPGLKEALKRLTEQGCMITLWSTGSGTSAIDAVNKIMQSLGIQVMFTPFHLGAEHCFNREGNVKEKNVRFFNRPPNSILLVDSDKRSEEVNPNNAFIVKSMTEIDAMKKETPDKPVNDTTLLAIAALVERIRADFQTIGRVDVPRTLASVRNEAGIRGFGTDADGMYRYLLHAAWEAQEHERLRKEAGLGGTLRKTIEHMPALKAKPSVTEMAETKPFRDPVADAGEDALLTQKVHAAIARMDAMMGRPPRQ